MKVTKYEIDYLNVGAADAILIRFINDDNNEQFVVLIDAGNYSDGDIIAEFIQTRYNTKYIDLAICSHCDADHFGGFINLLKKHSDITIEEFWINDPGLHVSVDEYKRYRNIDNLRKEARIIYDLNGDNLIDLLDEKRINRNEAFSYGGAFYNKWDGMIDIIGPTKDYYENLVPNLRHSLEAYDESEDESLKCFSASCLSPSLDAAKDDSSTHNQSSIIILFSPSKDQKFLFMADAGEDAVNNIFASDWEKCKDVLVLKVPHHGSKHNLTSDIINHINPVYSIISTEKVGKYLSMATQNALKNNNSEVYSTHKCGNLCYQCGFPERSDYTSATPL